MIGIEQIAHALFIEQIGQLPIRAGYFCSSIRTDDAIFCELRLDVMRKTASVVFGPKSILAMLYLGAHTFQEMSFDYADPNYDSELVGFIYRYFQ